MKNTTTVKCSYVSKNNNQCSTRANEKYNGMCKKHYDLSSRAQCSKLTKKGTPCKFKEFKNGACKRHCEFTLATLKISADNEIDMKIHPDFDIEQVTDAVIQEYNNYVYYNEQMNEFLAMNENDGSYQEANDDQDYVSDTETVFDPTEELQSYI